jgi:hypothetical protein
MKVDSQIKESRKAQGKRWKKTTGSELSSGMKINRLKNITKNYILIKGLGVNQYIQHSINVQ